MTLPEVTASPEWIDHARAAWLPREGHVEPLRVDAWLRSPVAFDRGEGLRLDGALTWVVVALTTGLPPPEAFAGVPKGAYVDIPVPIADVVVEGWRVAMCSDAALAPVAEEVVRRRRKKPHPEAMALAKVQTTGGPWKALDIPVAAWSTPTLTWWLMGDAERLRALLGELRALGRGRAGGLGHVEAWSVTPDPEAAERWRDRAMPVRLDTAAADATRAAAGDPAAMTAAHRDALALTLSAMEHRARAALAERHPGRVVREANVRAAYWHPRTRTLAACPET